MKWTFLSGWMAFWWCTIMAHPGQAMNEIKASTTMMADTVYVEFGGGTFQHGDTICLDMITRGFNNVNSMQFTLNWDPSVIRFIEVKDVNPGGQINQFFASSFGATSAQNGSIRFVWYDDALDGESAPDDFRMARLCFVVTGNPGDKTSLIIGNVPLKIEVLDPDNNEFVLPVLMNAICVGDPSDLHIKASACSTTDNDGYITIQGWSSSLPITVDIPALAVVGDLISTSGDILMYNNLSPGAYMITARDATGKDTIININVYNRERIFIDTVDLRFPGCVGESNGHIEIAINGGVAPYFINWSPIQASGETILRRIPADLYTVVVEDSLGCMAKDTFDLNSELLVIDTQLLKIASCEGANDGELLVIPSGGAPFTNGQYQFFWSDGSNERNSTSLNSNLSGSGYVIVSDAAGCMDTVFFDIPSRSNLELAIRIDSTQCHGDSSGRVSIVGGNGGTPALPYRYIIRTLSGQFVVGGAVLLDEYMHDSIWGGQFVVTLEDDNGCTVIDTFEVLEPDPLEVIIVDADTTADCGMDNAYLEVDGYGGAGGPYTFQWDIQSSNSRIDGLSPSNYTVTVTDRNMCTSERTFYITGSNGPTIDGIQKEDVGCPADSSGSATVDYTEGSAPVTSIQWSNGDSGTMATGLAAGRYYVTITDDNGCSTIDSVDIDVPMNALNITSFIIDTPSCNGARNGFLQIEVSGGVGSYTYQWNTGSRDSIITNIGAGRYIVAVRDGSNCPPVIDSFDIPEPPKINIEVLAVEPVSCNNDTTCDGGAIAMASGGPDPSTGYIFTWRSGEIGFNNPDTAYALCKGPQSLVVSNGDCADSVEVIIDAPPALEIDFDATEIVLPTCFGYIDGSITLAPTGGTGVKTVTWDRGSFMGRTLNNIGAGIYYMVVEDGNGCRYRDSIEVRDPEKLEAQILEAGTTDITCPEGQDGRITLVWKGGNPGNAEFSWTPNITTDSVALGLVSDTYQIIVTDSRGCTDTVIRTLVEPEAITADFPASDSVLCYGDQVPVTVIAANGGNGPEYSFSINNGSRRSLGEEVNLFGGTYLVQVFDAKGCAIDSVITLYQPADFQVDLGPSPIEIALGDSLVICYQTNLSGRTLDSVIWTGPGTPNDPSLRCYRIKPLVNTTYSIEIQDEFGCSAYDELQVIVVNEGKVFVPNIFNPNGNVNTVLSVHYGKSVEAINSMKIYNRWGEMVYQGIDLQPGEGWNGRWDNTGEIMLSGVYVYVVEVRYKDGTEEVRRGDVTLFR